MEDGKRSSLKVNLMVIACLIFSIGSANGEEKPNIMIWVADDQYLESVGVYGGDAIQTPNIDDFAEQGMRFTKAYSTTSICTPARSALYTGMYPIHNGSHPNHSGLKKDVASMPTLMKKLGYRTALVGKHGVHKKPTRPNNTFVWDAEYPHNGKPVEGTERGGKVADKHKGIDYEGVRGFLNDGDQPFIMFVAATLPHGPELGKISNGLEGYAANNWLADHQFGQFLEMLDDAGKTENTIVIYVSDHGSNTPFSKYTLYEPAVHVPMIVRWPGRIEANSTSRQLVDFTDIMPTLMELAGGHPSREMDGKSLVPLLNGDEIALREDIFLSFTALGVKEILTPYPIRSVVTERYKLIHNINYKVGNPKGKSKQKTSTEFELYDLREDPQEDNNLAGMIEYRKIQADLLSRLGKWQEIVGDKGIYTELEAVDMFPEELAALKADLFANADTLAFPGAEGAGKFTKGGRGGDVYHVTNLEDSGPGSFREGIESIKGPRTIVFDVGGTIRLKKNLEIIGKSNLTIAGQTAPGKGITLADWGLIVKDCSHIVIRYLRSRLGDENKTEKVGTDSIMVNHSDHVILDHLSMSWGIDGNGDFRGLKYATLQWLIFSEALNDSIHYENMPHAMASSFREPVGQATLHHNIYATSRHRHPSTAGGASVFEFVNNLDYNWTTGHNISGQQFNLINNYYRAGPMNKGELPLQYKTKEPEPVSRGYFSGNYFDGLPEEYNSDNYSAMNYEAFNNRYKSTTREFFVASKRFDAGKYKLTNIETAQEAYESTLMKSGSSLVRDKVDERLIKSIINGTGKVIDSQKDVGGWDFYPSLVRPAGFDTDLDGMPDEWERKVDLNPKDPADGNKDRNEDGFTNLEEYLNSLTQQNRMSKNAKT